MLRIARLSRPSAALVAVLAACSSDHPGPPGTTSSTTITTTTTTSAGGRGGGVGLGGGGGDAGGHGGGGGSSFCEPGAQVPCYPGPAGTEGVGTCTAGTQTCAADGSTYEACLGAVVPLPEDCSTADDEDCDGVAAQCVLSCLWSHAWGDAADQQEARSIATDATQSVIVGGWFRGTLQTGGAPLTSVGETDIFVAKLAPDGTHQWSKAFGATDFDELSAVAVDGAGDVLIAGDFSATIDLGGGLLTSAGSADALLAKFDAQGNYLWAKRFGDSAAQGASRVASDAASNVIVLGDFEGTIDLGGGPLLSAGQRDVFVAKFSPSGLHLWSMRFGGPINDGATGLAVDSGGDVIVSGYFQQTIDLGGGPLVSAGAADAFVVKLSPNGGHLWSKRFGDGLDQNSNGVAVDSTDNVFVLSEFAGLLDFGGGALVGQGGWDIGLAKLDPTGAHIWSKRFGDGASQYPRALAVSPSGAVFVTGFADGTVDFGGGALTSQGSDIFVAKFTATGAHYWSAIFLGGASLQAAMGAAIDLGGNALVAGMFDGSVDFGCGTLSTAGALDAFVARFAP